VGASFLKQKQIKSWSGTVSQNCIKRKEFVASLTGMVTVGRKFCKIYEIHYFRESTSVAHKPQSLLDPIYTPVIFLFALQII
jgi:hypothetical protein